MNKKLIQCAWPLLLLLAVAVFAPVLAPWDPWEMTEPFLRPSVQHLLGTNDVGQDILSELIYGARTSLIVGFSAALVITVFGSFIGACAAYFGGWADAGIMLLINVALSVPSLPLIIVLSAFLNRSIGNIILCTCLTGWVGTARIVRSQTLRLKELGFIRNCRTMGCGSLYIILRHLLPNLKETILTKGLLSVASAMLTETSISYLGLGPISGKSWGRILSDAFRAGGIFNGYWWWYLPPIFCISLTVFCFLSLTEWKTEASVSQSTNGKDKIMKRTKQIVSLLLCLVMTLSLAACGANTARSEEDSGASGADVELLRVGSIYQFDVESPYCELLKYLSYDGFLYSNLVRYGADNEVVPCLCQRFEIAEDGTAVTFYFKEGIKWHDGQPLTMEDIAFSLNLWLEVLKPSVALRYMKSVEVLDDTSIRVNMQSSCAYVFLRHMIMSSSGCVIYPKHIWENVEDLKTFTGRDAMIGCGPYMYDSYDDEAKIAYFNRFEEYHEGTPTIKRIAFHLYESPESLVMAFKNGEIDCMFQYAAGLSGNFVPALQELSALNIGKEMNLGGPILEFNFQDALMQDLAMRSAVYYALDYELLAATDGGEYCVPGTKGVISPGNIGYADDLPSNRQNMEEANRILDEAGYMDVNADGLRENKDGSAMRIMVSPAYNASKGVLYQRLAQVVVQNLRDVGLDAYLDEDVSNSDAWKARWRGNKDFQIAVTSCSQGVAIIDTVNQGLVEKAGSDGTLTWNGTNNNPEYVELFSRIIDSKNQEEYAAAAYASQHYLADQMVAISLGVESMFYPYNIQNFTGWSFRSGNGAFSYDTWFTLKSK